MAREFSDYLDTIIENQGDPQTWEQANRFVQEACLAMGADRHRDYGPENIMQDGHLGIAVRIGDKRARIKNIVLKSLSYVNSSIRGQSLEKLEDSCADLSNYGTYGVMLERKIKNGMVWWLLPLAEDKTPLSPSSETSN